MSPHHLRTLALLLLSLLLQGCLYVELYGPVTGASVTITPLRGGAPIVDGATSYSLQKTRGLFSDEEWQGMPESDRLSLMGAVDLPKEDFSPNTYYLVTVSGGLDQDFNTDGQIDARGEPILGSWHAILTGAELKGIARVSVVTEAIYQYLLPDLEDMDDDELAAALDDAAQRVVGDIDGNDMVNYTDVVRWSATAYADQFRGEAFLMDRLREDVEFNLSAEVLAIDSIQFVERAAWTAAKAQSPYADDLVSCLSPVYVPDLCSLNDFPLIGLESNQPTVADLMNRVVVSHEWMGERFEQMLEQMPDMLLTLSRSVSAIVIADTVRPAYFDPVTNAIFLDPDFFWLTQEERDTVSEEADFRTEFASNVSFTDLFRFVRNGRSVGATAYDVAEDGSRTLEQAVPVAASVLFHEFAHATDAIPPSAFASLFTSLAPFQQRPSFVSTDLTEISPLTTPELFGVAQVLFRGADPTEAEKSYTPAEVGAFFEADRANDLYAFSTQFEDLAMLVEEFMMATYFDAQRHVGFTNAPTGSTDDIECDDYRIAWGQLSRVSQPEVRSRLEFALNGLLPDQNFSAELAALPASKTLPLGLGWCEYLDQLSGAVSPQGWTSTSASRPLPDRRRRYE